MAWARLPLGYFSAFPTHTGSRSHHKLDSREASLAKTEESERMKDLPVCNELTRGAKRCSELAFAVLRH
jgi:hypothetical protein